MLKKTGAKNLLEFDLLLVLIYDKARTHWALAIIDMRNKEIVVANSLREAHMRKGRGVPDFATKPANAWLEYA